jgi:hypothetical protein
MHANCNGSGSIDLLPTEVGSLAYKLVASASVMGSTSEPHPIAARDGHLSNGYMCLHYVCETHDVQIYVCL